MSAPKRTPRGEAAIAAKQAEREQLGLAHTGRIEALLNAGRREEARALHLAHVDAELERASSEPINLSDLMAGAEAFAVDRINREEGGR